MNSLTYLLIHTTKNRIKDTIKSPGKLIAYLIGIGFLSFFLITSLRTGPPEIDFGDADAYATEPNFLLLKGILFGFFLMMYLFPTIFAGSKGSSQYGMEDVNFLFVSPIRARTILLYGIVQAFKTILIGSWFVIFQAAWLRDAFGIGAGGLFLLWLAYVLFALTVQMLSIFLYAMTSGDSAKLGLAKVVIAASFVPLVVDVMMRFFAAGGEISGLLDAIIGSAVLDFTPLVGWAAA
ncbi:MAG: putative ABC exporter domain-containing protein, partial [Defluviitaleaceae bacterium]|nr:putative ABC exporter domain-containing protein [Defluviitaleaceae bacterium]